MKFIRILFLSTLIFFSLSKAFSQASNGVDLNNYGNYNPEIDNNNLMLVEATLELNEAMLAGIKASLDTLSKPDPEIKNKNDVKEILQRMKRKRDRTELVPYLQYMNDSLSLDCTKLNTQKQSIQARLTAYYEHKLADSLALVKANVASSKVNTTSKANKAAKKLEKKPATETATVVLKDTIAAKKPTPVDKATAKQKEAKSFGRDTVLVYDLGKTETPKPAKEKNSKPVGAVAKADTVRKPIMDTTTKKQMAERKKASSDSVQAAIALEEIAKQQQKQRTKHIADSLAVAQRTSKKETSKPVKIDSVMVVKKQAEPKKGTEQTKKADTLVVVTFEDKKNKPQTIEAKPALTKRDTAAKTIERDVMQAKARTDTVKKVEAKPAPVAEKKDTTVKTSMATVSSKTATTKSSVADNATSADTIQHIKSQFLLKRAQKAIAEKKNNQAEEYLNKSLELWSDNYDTWMTLADLHASTGLQAVALKEYQECVRIDSSKAKLFYSMAAVYLQSKRKTEAAQYFTKTLALDSTYLLAYMGRASVLSDWKKYDEAIRDYDKVLALNKSYHYAYKARGMVKQLNKRFSEAVDDFTRYLIFEETDPSAYYYRGLAKIGNNELLEGCLDLSKSAEMGYDAAEKAIKKSCE